MEFPALVYRCPGLHQRKGGTFDWRNALDQDDLDEAIANGWFLSLPEAIDAYDNPSSVLADNAPPTREELNAKASELGIKFDGRTSDAALLAKIDAALKDQ